MVVVPVPPHATPAPPAFVPRYLACWVGAGGGRTSLSPAQYDQAFRELGVAGMQHVVDFDALPGLGAGEGEGAVRLAAVLQMVRTMGWCGGSVTHPFKEAVLPLLDEVDPAAAAMGACNTLVARGGRLVGHNTDWMGAAAALEEAALPPGALEAVAVVGVGGAPPPLCRARATGPVSKPLVAQCFSNCEPLAAGTRSNTLPPSTSPRRRGARGVLRAGPGRRGHPPALRPRAGRGPSSPLQNLNPCSGSRLLTCDLIPNEFVGIMNAKLSPESCSGSRIASAGKAEAAAAAMRAGFAAHGAGLALPSQR
jgi:hypothetical protein